MEGWWAVHFPKKWFTLNSLGWATWRIRPRVTAHWCPHWHHRVRLTPFLIDLGLWGPEGTLGCRKWGCNKWGLKGWLAALPGNQPKSAEIALFLPFFALSRRVRRAIQKTEEKGLFPQISSDLLKPPSLKPPFAALQGLYPGRQGLWYGGGKVVWYERACSRLTQQHGTQDCMLSWVELLWEG